MRRLCKNSLLILILVLSAFLRFYRLNGLMPFIGDQGWFYLSARDMLLTHKIPLIGITSSHTWLHQGPLWTYMLAVFLYLFNFNPLAGAYLSAGINILTILVIYITARELFSDRIALIASFLYTTSPLIIIFARMPYHTSPISLGVALFLLFIFKWIKGNYSYFPLTILSLAVLYNFELATVLFVFGFLAIIFYGIKTRAKWISSIFKKNILIFVIAAGVIPMLPILIYDSTHKFAQTIGYSVWLIYSILRILFFPFFPKHASDSFISFLGFATDSLQKLIFLPNRELAVFGFILIFIIGLYVFFNRINVAKTRVSYVVFSVTGGVVIIGFMFMHTISEAYLPMFFPYVMLFLAIVLDWLFAIRLGKYLVVIILFVLTVENFFTLLQKDYLMNQSKDGYGPSLDKRIAAARYIVHKTGGRPYNIKGVGSGSQFKSYTMNYEYLVWWLGFPVSQKKEKILFYIHDTPNNIIIWEKKHD